MSKSDFAGYEFNPRTNSMKSAIIPIHTQRMEMCKHSYSLRRYGSVPILENCYSMVPAKMEVKQIRSWTNNRIRESTSLKKNKDNRLRLYTRQRCKSPFWNKSRRNLTDFATREFAAIVQYNAKSNSAGRRQRWRLLYCN